MAPKCWSLGNFSSDSGDCKADELLCKEGSRSVLCGSCDDEYYYSVTSGICESCSGGSMVDTWIFVAGVAAFLALYLAVRNGSVVLPEWISSLWILGMFSNIDSGCFKVLFSSYQIIQSVSFTYVSVISLLCDLMCSPFPHGNEIICCYLYSHLRS